MNRLLIISPLLACFMACSESKKGSWSAEEIKKAKAELNSIVFEKSKNEEDKLKLIDCFLEKVEINYNNFEEAKNDSFGTDLILRECENKN
jgi:hypothetical protein